jgi:hypothetical protein
MVSTSMGRSKRDPVIETVAASPVKYVAFGIAGVLAVGVGLYIVRGMR